ncbi:MAG: phosphatidylserine decarboxylase [Chitinophagales bacterium]|nr:phosphatidylserine decarboxylase [Chitinophagales bacterium]MDW8418054.1 phosphatidylserine decarboxylase [Chitinophagales bacterium]
MIKKIAGVLLILSLTLLAYYRFWFLRLPERKIPHDEKAIVSPANGKVVAVFPWNDSLLLITKKDMGALRTWTGDLDTAGYVVHIQMNVTNVHYQRAPTDAVVVSERYVPGNFANAVMMNNEWGIRFENEHNEITLQTPAGRRYKVIQIAGFVARRIDDYVQKGQPVKQGDVIGLIKLGSQVTLVLPHDVKVLVKPGDTVIEGESIVAEWHY